MAEEIVTVARFTEPLEADMARLRLQSAGIEVFLTGEHARILEPGLGDLRLQVAAEDETDALAILADLGDTRIPQSAAQMGPGDELA